MPIDVKAVFTATKVEIEANAATSLRYKILAAHNQLAAKRETLLAAKREIDQLGSDITDLEVILDECERGHPDRLDKWCARRAGEGMALGKAETRLEPGPRAANPQAVVNINN